MSESLEKWVEAAVTVADAENMKDEEVIPTWPEFCVERFPDRYPQLTVGALRRWQASHAQIGEARAIVDQVIAELEAGFVRCERCGYQEDTATLDCMSDLKRLQALLQENSK